MAQLELVNLTKFYPPEDLLVPEKPAVDRFSLLVEPGEFVVLYGPTGCGKSTILRLIAGLLDPTDGDILFDGKSQKKVKAEVRDVSMVFQDYALYPHFTVEKNIGYPLKTLKVPKNVIDEKVSEILALLELQDVRRKKPRALSGSEMQRTAVGRALVRKPSFLLMDEPFSNLDAPLRMQLRSFLKQIHQRMETTIIYVTHDQAEAMSLATRLVLMKDGQLVQAGAPADIYRNPDNMAASSLIGTPEINLFEQTEVSGEGEARTVTLLGKQYPCPPVENSLSEKRVILGIRPEHFELFQDSGTEEDGRILCIIDSTEVLGAEMFLYLSEIRTGSPIRVRTRLAGAALLARAGQELWVRPKLGHAFLFDSETGKRIL